METNSLIQIEEWQDLFLSASNDFVSTFASYLPKLVGAAFIIVLGILIAKLLAKLSRTVLKKVRVISFVKKTDVDGQLEKAGIKVDLTEVISNIVYWLVFLIFLTAAADVLGLNVVVSTIDTFIQYLPNLISAIIVAILTIAASKVVSDTVEASLEQMKIAYKGLVSRLSGFMVILLGSTIVASQLGLDITIITANITLIIAGVIATIVLSLGLGSRDTVGNLVAGHYVKKTVKVGDELMYDGKKMKVSSLSETHVVLEHDSNRVLVSNNELMR